MKRPLALLALAALMLPSTPSMAAAVDLFYRSLLREGAQQYEREDFPGAARTLRLACFGMLDEPAALADCLARLALAQDRAGDAEGFQETFLRLVEVEERFQAYTRGQLAPELRAALEQRLAAEIPASTLRSIPAFQRLAESAEPPASGREPKSRRSESARTAPPPSPSAPASSDVAAGAPSPVPPAPVTQADRQKLAEARRLLAEVGKVRELRNAFQLAREVADAHPEWVEAQHLAAEAAYRISRWEDSARYFRRGGDPGESQPELLFYLAVALYESGEAEAAASVLQRSLPNLQRSPYVDAYARKILG